MNSTGDTASAMSSVEVPGSTAAPGETKPRMHVVWTRPGVTSFALDGCNNLHDLFLRGLRLADGGSGPFLGHRRILRTNSSSIPSAAAAAAVSSEYSWLSYSEGLQRASNFGSGLAKLGVAQGTHLAFFAQNCAEYFIAREACNMYGFVAVPLYDTLGREAIETIVEDADIEVVLATCVKARILLDMVESIPKVKRIVLMDGAEDDVIEAADATGVRLDEQTTIEALGATQPEPPARVPTKDDAFAIIHTSGVSGKPKGVVLTHGNMLAAVGQIHLLVQQRMLYQFSKQDVYLSFLPLAHVMEQYLTTVLVSFGASIAVSQGNTLKLMDDLVTLRPTCFCAVPRIFNRIYGKVWDSVRAKGHASALLFKAAYSAKIANLRNGKITHWLWDRVIFKTLKDRLGGRVSFILSGSAPLGTDVLDFLRIGFAADTYEAWGSTETTAGGSLSMLGDTDAGHVGAPLPAVHVKLVDVPELGYLTADKPHPRGEVCVRGETVFKGYYKQPEKTREVLDADGWYHTGDIGSFDETGRLRIIDRARNIVKLSQGEFLALEHIENIVSTHPAVSMAYVYGDPLQSYLVGIVVPEEQGLRDVIAAEYAEDAGRLESPSAASLEQLCRNNDVRKLVVRELGLHARRAGLKGFETIKAVHLEAQPFTVEQGILTPTLKIKRHAARDAFKTQIAQLYAESASN